MRFLAVLLAALLCLPPVLTAQTWATVVDKLEKSVVQLAVNCSGFVINTEKHYVLTAAHCGPDDIAKPFLVDSRPSKIVAIDLHKDFLVVEVPELDRPQLQMADRNPEIGDMLASYGFGYGLERPMLRLAYVSQDRALIADAGPGEWVMLDSAFVGGQSGAPVVNLKGEVVMLVQMASDRVGLGRGIETIRDRVGKYWGKSRTP